MTDSVEDVRPRPREAEGRVDASAPAPRHVAALLEALEEMDGAAALALGFDALDDLYEEVLRLRERACGAELEAAATAFSSIPVANFLLARAKRESLPVGTPLSEAMAMAMAETIVEMEARGVGARVVADTAAGMVLTDADSGSNAVTLLPTIRAAAEDVVAARRAGRRGAGRDERGGDGPESMDRGAGFDWVKLRDPGGAQVHAAEIEGVGKFWITSESGAAGMTLFPDNGADLTYWEDSGDVSVLKRIAAAHLRKLRKVRAR